MMIERIKTKLEEIAVDISCDMAKDDYNSAEKGKKLEVLKKRYETLAEILHEIYSMENWVDFFKLYVNGDLMHWGIDPAEDRTLDEFLKDCV